MSKIDMRQTVEEAAKDYAIGKTFFRKNVLKEVDADDYVLRKDDCREDFKAGVEWEMAEAINAHWKSCPNLSKDNDRMCNQMNDCNQNCEYMRSFIRLLEE
ncbi:hypothetical protein [Parabacteroides distasonis]|uniref:hypothetical protein n=1 Tax=Parabacteroides distasonis TaxID=823 RepID=UPI003568A790